MPDASDIALLREFAGQNSEAAFAELVGRHINLVYSIALRLTGNNGDAEDVTQAVFIILARKAARLSHRTVITGWLYETTRFTAMRLLRTQARRRAYEQEASVQTILEQSADDNLWQQLKPHLETAMSRLGPTDRTLLTLRFYENKTGAEAAALLGIREETARRRASRALEKLRAWYSKRGINSTAGTIAGAISANSIQIAPAGLAKTISALAITKGAAASTSTLPLVKGALKLMAWTKVKTAIAVGVGILLAAGTATITVKEIQNYRDDNYSWQVENPTPDILNTLPLLVKIVPTKFPNSRESKLVSLGSSSLGIGVRVQDILGMAYNEDALYDPKKRLRMLLLTKIPSAKYDYIANFGLHNSEEIQQDNERQSSGNVGELQRALKKQFRLVGRRETIVTNVLLLEVKYPNAPGLEPVTAENQASLNQMPGEICFQDQGCRILVGALANEFRMMPVLDETGLTNRYYYDLKWTPSRAQRQNQLNLKQALLNQLGLELVPASRPIKFLVIEKAN